MSDPDEPELHVIRFPPEAGAERRAQAASHRQEARARYLAHLTPVPPEATAIIDWASPAGVALTSAREAERKELAGWLSGRSEVVVRTYGGWTPEQWWGEIDGHSFYFRERHDHWRIELDMRPSGRFSEVWVGGDIDDDANLEPREIEVGDVIAEGNTAVAGYGDSPMERLRFILGIVRAHLVRRSCAVHTDDRDSLELLWGRPLAWCPACGTSLSEPARSTVSD